MIWMWGIVEAFEVHKSLEGGEPCGAIRRVVIGDAELMEFTCNGYQNGRAPIPS